MPSCPTRSVAGKSCHERARLSTKRHACVHIARFRLKKEQTLIRICRYELNKFCAFHTVLVMLIYYKDAWSKLQYYYDNVMVHPCGRRLTSACSLRACGTSQQSHSDLQRRIRRELMSTHGAARALSLRDRPRVIRASSWQTCHSSKHPCCRYLFVPHCNRIRQDETELVQDWV